MGASSTFGGDDDDACTLFRFRSLGMVLTVDRLALLISMRYRHMVRQEAMAVTTEADEFRHWCYRYREAESEQYLYHCRKHSRRPFEVGSVD